MLLPSARIGASTVALTRLQLTRSFRTLSPTTKVTTSTLQTRRNMSVSTHPSLTLVTTSRKSMLYLVWSLTLALTHWFEDAPAAVGPYTQAVRVGDLLFASGSLGLDPAVGKLVRTYISYSAIHAKLGLGH